MTTNTSNIADARNTDNKNNQQPMTCGAMMRFVAAAIILMTSMPAMAQVNFGICGGVVIEQSMPDSDSKDSERYIGYTAGAIVDFDLPAQGLGIEAGAMCTKHTYAPDDTPPKRKRGQERGRKGIYDHDGESPALSRIAVNRCWSKKYAPRAGEKGERL